MKKRNIVDVIDQIKGISANERLHERMDRIAKDSFYTPPERMSELWTRLQFELFQAYNSPFESEESLEVFSIFTTRSKEELLRKRDENEI